MDTPTNKGKQIVRLRPEEIGTIIGRFRQLVKAGTLVVDAYNIIGTELNLKPSTVQNVIRRLKSSQRIATEYLQANALRLAMRVARKANVDQSIDILSRPNIGVLEPIKRNENSGGGFFLAVSADSCGAVKVVAGQSPEEAPLSLPAGPDILDEEPIETQRTPFETDPECGETDTEEVILPSPYSVPGVPHPGQGSIGGSKKYKEAVTKARERIEAAKEGGPRFYPSNNDLKSRPRLAKSVKV